MIGTRAFPAIGLIICLVVMSNSAFLAPAVAQTRPGNGSGIMEFKGTVVPVRVAEIAPRFDGLLKTIHFSPGQFVEKGALCFEFLPMQY